MKKDNIYLWCAFVVFSIIDGFVLHFNWIFITYVCLVIPIIGFAFLFGKIRDYYIRKHCRGKK